MSTCEKCGAPKDAGAFVCQSCGHSSADLEAPPKPSPQIKEGRTSTSIYRPTGGAFIVSGWVFMGLSVAAWLVGRVLLGTLSSARSFSDVGQGLAIGTWLQESAGALFGYSIFMLAAGYVIRAIWFVPGPEEKTVP